MNSLTDQQLLRDYTGRRSEAAFAELVRRHVDFVYSAALRMVRDAHLAEDVTQSVFVALAQNARQLADHSVLSGWLHRTAQNLAANTVRSDVRRRAREQEAAAMNELLTAEPDDNWEHIAPQLDAALGELSEPDRDALLLRYFERKSAREMAEVLGVSDDAAQKRVSRAIERLREFLSKRGIAVGVSGLAALIGANAVQAAPVGLAATVLAGTTMAATATATITKTIAMTTLQKTLITTTLAVVAGAGIYEARQASTLRSQVQTLRQQETPLTEQIAQLQRERDEMTSQMRALLAENRQLKSKPSAIELQKLRGDATRLADRSAALAKENEELKMKISAIEGRWFNVTNSPQFSMPYFPKDRWKIKDDRSDTTWVLLSAARAAMDENESKLSELITDAKSQSLFSKQRWNDVKGVQIVSDCYITENGEERAIVGTILMKATGGPSEPGQPPALDELVHTYPEMHRWFFARTGDGWKITGGD